MNTPYIECLSEGSWSPLFLVFLELRIGLTDWRWRGSWGWINQEEMEIPITDPWGPVYLTTCSWYLWVSGGKYTIHGSYGFFAVSFREGIICIFFGVRLRITINLDWPVLLRRGRVLSETINYTHVPSIYIITYTLGKFHHYVAPPQLQFRRFSKRIAPQKWPHIHKKTEVDDTLEETNVESIHSEETSN